MAGVHFAVARRSFLRQAYLHEVFHHRTGLVLPPDHAELAAVPEEGRRRCGLVLDHVRERRAWSEQPAVATDRFQAPGGLVLDHVRRRLDLRHLVRHHPDGRDALAVWDEVRRQDAERDGIPAAPQDGGELRDTRVDDKGYCLNVRVSPRGACHRVPEQGGRAGASAAVSADDNRLGRTIRVREIRTRIRDDTRASNRPRPIPNAMSGPASRRSSSCRNSSRTMDCSEDRNPT